MPRRRRVGRVERQVRRCLIAADDDVQFSDLVAWSYAGGRRVWRQVIYRALKKYAVNVGYGRWAPNDALARQIRGDD